MRARLLQHPYWDSDSVGDFLDEAMSDSEVSHMDICVAWVARSGLTLHAEQLTNFVARGGRLRIVAGISLGAATRQGLELLRRLAPEGAFIFHHPGRTFHPKMYAAYSKTTASVVTGSQNMTASGLLRSFEVATRVDVHEAGDSDGWHFVRQAQGYFERLLADTAVCKPLTGDLLKAIIEDPSLVLRDEDAPPTPHTKDGLASSSEAQPLFGQSGEQLRDVHVDQTYSRERLSVEAVLPNSSLTWPDDVAARWYKELPASNVNRLYGSHEQNHVTLTKAKHPIDQSTYFRRGLFRDVRWVTQVEDGREHAFVDFEVTSYGDYLGTFQLIVDHYPSFASAQGNRSTTIRWNAELAHHLRVVRDHTKDFLTIERSFDGRYLLCFSAFPRGEFI